MGYVMLGLVGMGCMGIMLIGVGLIMEAFIYKRSLDIDLKMMDNDKGEIEG